MGDRLNRFDKRRAERFDLRDVIHVICSLDHEYAVRAELLDVSREGCSLRVPLDGHRVTVSNKTNLEARLSFGESSYMPLSLKPMSYRTITDQGKRYAVIGCVVESTANSYEAYLRFIEFLAFFSVVATQDVVADVANF